MRFCWNDVPRCVFGEESYAETRCSVSLRDVFNTFWSAEDCCCRPGRGVQINSSARILKIVIRITGSYAGWQQGLVERHGGVLGGVWSKVADEFAIEGVRRTWHWQCVSKERDCDEVRCLSPPQALSGRPLRRLRPKRTRRLPVSRGPSWSSSQVRTVAVIALLLRYLQERLRAALLRKSPTETLFRTGIFLPATFQQKVSIGISTMERTGLSFKRTEGVETEHSRLQQKTLRFASSEKAAAVEAIDSSSEVNHEGIVIRRKIQNKLQKTHSMSHHQQNSHRKH